MLPPFPKSFVFLEGPWVSPNCCSGKSNLYIMNMGHWWNDTDREKTEVLGEKTFGRATFVHHKTHTAWPGIEHGSPRLEFDD